MRAETCPSDYALDKDSFKKVIIVRDNIKLRRDENGIITMSLKEFLLNENIFEN